MSERVVALLARAQDDGDFRASLLRATPEELTNLGLKPGQQAVLLSNLWLRNPLMWAVLVCSALGILLSMKVGGYIFMAFRFSARNQLQGRLKSVKLGEVMAEVVVELPDGQEIVSAITRTSAESLNLKQGDAVVAIIKSTEVMIGIND